MLFFNSSIGCAINSTFVPSCLNLSSSVVARSSKSVSRSLSDFGGSSTFSTTLIVQVFQNFDDRLNVTLLRLRLAALEARHQAAQLLVRHFDPRGNERFERSANVGENVVLHLLGRRELVELDHARVG